MSPDKLVDENDPSTWVAKTKVAPVKFTKSFLFNKVNPPTYTQIHSPAWYKGEGWEPLPRVFDHDNLQYFETILPSVEIL